MDDRCEIMIGLETTQAVRFAYRFAVIVRSEHCISPPHDPSLRFEQTLQACYFVTQHLDCFPLFISFATNHPCLHHQVIDEIDKLRIACLLGKICNAIKISVNVHNCLSV